MDYCSKYIKKLKVYKKPKKETDKCSLCILGKKSIDTLKKSNFLEENKDEINKLNENIKIFNQHIEDYRTQYCYFKFLKNESFLKNNTGNIYY